MSLIDILINLIIWVIQNMILPLLPMNLPFLSFQNFKLILDGSVKHNFIWSLAGLNQFMNLELLFILIGVIISAEIIFWSIKAGLFLLKFIRGSG